MTEPVEEAKELFDSLDTDDVGQKRYEMFAIFDLLLEQVYRDSDRELPPRGERIRELKNFQGYTYKLAQEFLTSSSTLKKEKKLEKMLDYVKK